MPVTTRATKRRVHNADGTFTWVPIASSMNGEAEGVMNDLSDAPESAAPFVPPVYYYPFRRNHVWRLNRPDEVRVMDWRIWPHDADEEAQVREYLSAEVPGSNPDRWLGDTSPESLECSECGFVTRNFAAWKDHARQLGHASKP